MKQVLLLTGVAAILMGYAWHRRRVDHLIISKLNHIMASEQDFLDALGRIDQATDNIAADLRKLADQIAGGGLPAGVEASVLAKLNDAATKLEAVAAETPDGEPTPEPPTT